jgi:hypothetical protein
MNCSEEVLMQWIEDRIAPDPNSGCFIWMGSLASPGYGDFTWKGKRHTVHRFLLEKSTGPLKRGEYALHTCDNRWCVRLAHLFRGTQRDNTWDMIRKGRHNFQGLRLMQTPGVPHRKEGP